MSEAATARSCPVPSTLTSPTPSGVATSVSCDLDQQDSTPPRAQQDFENTGPSPMPPQKGEVRPRPLVLGPRNGTTLATGGRIFALSLSGSYPGGLTPSSSPSPCIRSRRRGSSWGLPLLCPVAARTRNSGDY